MILVVLLRLSLLLIPFQLQLLPLLLQLSVLPKKTLARFVAGFTEGFGGSMRNTPFRVGVNQEGGKEDWKGEHRELLPWIFVRQTAEHDVRFS
jgi:hypothetical protein